MRIFITGICGFVGSEMALALQESLENASICGIDNFIRPGSHENIARLRQRGIEVRHGDSRNPSDVASNKGFDWVVDASAIPSVLAGVSGSVTPRQLIDHNLSSAINLLECCRQWQAGFTLLSSSRVYSIEALNAIELEVHDDAFGLKNDHASSPRGLSDAGISEGFSTAAPISVYGATKLAAEALALEYGFTFDLPVLVNRCGVLAGGGQFGRPDQGIVAFWIHSYHSRRAMRYIGFGGHGWQVRDCLHPRDLTQLVIKQIQGSGGSSRPGIFNVSGGQASAFSLKQLSAWCAERLGEHPIASEDQLRRFDVPWVVLDSSKAQQAYDWTPEISTDMIFKEIAEHAACRPDWLDVSMGLQ